MQIFYNLKDFRTEYDLTQEELGKLLKVSKQSIWAFENNRELPAKHKKFLEEIYNCKFQSNKNKRKNQIDNSVIELELINPSENEPFEAFRISRQTIKSYIKCSAPENLKIFRISGDSMEPTVFDGDRLITDTHQTDLNTSGIYVFKVNNKFNCKRLYLSLDGNLHIKSDNSKYTEEIYKNLNISVIGRVLINLNQRM